MTISSTTRVAGPFTGSGSTATFPFTFKVFEASDLSVVTLDVATGAIAVLALTTDYTASLNADQDSSPSGSITLTAGNLATGTTLTIKQEWAQTVWGGEVLPPKKPPASVRQFLRTTLQKVLRVIGVLVGRE